MWAQVTTVYIRWEMDSSKGRKGHFGVHVLNAPLCNGHDQSELHHSSVG